MKISEQEMFDALTHYYKNDWRKTSLRHHGSSVEQFMTGGAW